MTAPLRLPFTRADHSIAIRDLTGDPWNAVLQVGGQGVIDIDRLRAAAQSVAARHPMARVRTADDPLRAAQPVWVVPDELDVDPVSERDCPDEASLDRLRAELLTTRIPLATSPPFRIVVARRPEGDVVLWASNHTPFDGLGALRALTTLARAYRGVDDPPDPIDIEAARSWRNDASGPPMTKPMSRTTFVLSFARRLRHGPAKVVADGGGGSGYGFVHRWLDQDEMHVVRAHRPAGASVNTLLVAAAIVAVDRWNVDHGRPAERLEATIPVSTRPAAWNGDVVGNFVSTLMIPTLPVDRRDLAAACRAVEAVVATWQASIASGPPPPVPAGSRLPMAIKRTLPRLLTVLTLGRTQPSVSLSNLGTASDDLRFDDVAPRFLLLHPLAEPPVGIGVAAIAQAGALGLTVRWHRSMLSDDAGRRLADAMFALILGPPA